MAAAVVVVAMVEAVVEAVVAVVAVVSFSLEELMAAASFKLLLMPNFLLRDETHAGTAEDEMPAALLAVWCLRRVSLSFGHWEGAGGGAARATAATAWVVMTGNRVIPLTFPQW